MPPHLKIYLTSQEIQILRDLALGNRMQTTSTNLKLAYKTVDRHRDNLRSKMAVHGISGIAQLTHYAIAVGIVKLMEFHTSYGENSPEVA